MATVPSSAPARSRPVAVILTPLLASAIAFQLSASMLSPVLVTMQREFHVGVLPISITNSLGLLSAAIFSLFTPRLSDILGRKRLLAICLVLLAIGSGISALAPNVPTLAVGRIVMGVAGPIVQITLLMLHSELREPKRFNTYAALIAAVNGGIAGIDVLAGGWIATNFGFRPVFWVIAVIALICIGLVVPLTRESRPTPTARMDWTGVALISLALVAAIEALTSAGALANADWTTVAIWTAIAVVAVVAFWQVQRRSRHPFVPRGALADRSSIALLCTSFLALGGEFAVINELVPALAQDTHHGFGFPADLTSLVLLTPFAIAGWIVGPFAGRVAARFGLAPILRIGLIGSVVVLVVLALAGTTSLALLIACVTLVGVFYAGMANIMLNTLGIVLAPAESPGYLPGLNSAMLNLGASVSFVIVPALQTAVPGAGGYALGIWGGTVLVALALITSLAIRGAPRVAQEGAPSELAPRT